MKNKIICGDSLEVLKDFEDNYFDSVVTDPPYGLSFMGKSWDYDVPQVELWKEVYRVLKPGGHILSFAGSRTYHRMAVNIEDAGFEIRDMLGWLYGSGFPKSHNIGKAVDKLQGNEREVVGKKIHSQKGVRVAEERTTIGAGAFGEPREGEITKGNSEWEGWGTALKPAHEPIVMARKPFNTSVAENVLTHGTGGINIDECRVGTGTNKEKKEYIPNDKNKVYGKNFGGGEWDKTQGRFPANIIHDGSEEVLEIFPETKQAGNLKKSKITSGNSMFGIGGIGKRNPKITGDNGGTAARFFYCAKASKAERNMGLDDFEGKLAGVGALRDNNRKSQLRKNYHPTVKPIKLMEYLVRLVTPKEGIVLEPFAGSGTTLIACKQQGFNYIGIEREQEYCDIAEARLKEVKVQGEIF